MLVLSRRDNESIIIGDKDDPAIGFEFTIVVVEIRGDKVRLGIDAPPNIPVHRREIYDAIKRSAAKQVEAHNRKNGF